MFVQRYQQAGKKEKTTILDELAKKIGYNQKYLLHQLANWEKIVTVRLGGKTVKMKATVCSC
jgi:hypothetical protein